MENWAVTLLTIAMLVVGLVGGFVLDKPEEVQVPGPEVIKEVLVEVPAECAEVEAVECSEGEASESILDLALEDFLIAVEDEEDESGEPVELLTCGTGNDEFDFDELSVSKVFDEWSVVFDDEETTVDFKVRMKYKETDERSCRETIKVRVHYEDDEDTLITDWNGYLFEIIP